MGEKMDLSDDILSSIGDVIAETGEPEGRQPVTCVIEYALLPEHLVDYKDQHGNLQSAQKADEKDIKTLRSRHHGVARMLAEGVPEGVVAEMTGYDRAYVSTLKNTPAMVELISFYRGPKNEAAKLIGERLRVAADMSLEIIEERLKKPEEADKLTINDLTAVAKLGFDRSGHGPQSTVHNIEEHRLVLPEELQELNRNARMKDASRIVDVEAVRAILPAPEKDDGQRDSSTDRSSDPDNSDSAL
jgi:hypothetical protein